MSNKMCKVIEVKVKMQNVSSLYKFTKLFNLLNLHKVTLSYIECSFTMFVETKSFRELDFIHVKNILGSPELEITSELEVFKAAHLWVSYDSAERSKFAKDLLSKVRFSLLSDHVLKYLLSESSSFTQNDKCIVILKEILENKINVGDYKLTTYLTSRYCSKSKFNIFVCGDHKPYHLNTVSNVYQIDGRNLKSLNVLPSMKENRARHKAVYVKGNVFVFGGYINDHETSMFGYDDAENSMMSVEKYSLSTKTWDIVSEMYDNRQNFSSCVFMDKVFIIGGSKHLPLDSCLHFDTNGNRFKWKEVAKMNEERRNAACAVYKGKIVVSGGYNNEQLRSVELYDVITDSWSPMPNMINSRSGHSLVVVSDKLFAIGIYTDRCEVFDNICKQFVALKSSKIKTLLSQDKVTTIGSKVIVIHDFSNYIDGYDVDKDEWFQESNGIVNYLQDFSCVKIPCY